MREWVELFFKRVADEDHRLHRSLGSLSQCVVEHAFDLRHAGGAGHAAHDAVKFGSRLTKVFVAASFLWLVILFVLTFMDYFSRGWLSNSKGWDDNPVKAAYDKGTEHLHHGKDTGAHKESEGEAKEGTDSGHSEEKAPSAH